MILFNLKEDSIKSLFVEDVQNLFNENNIRYIEDVSLTGRSKLQYNFDFAIPKTSEFPQRLIRTINNIDTSKAKNLIFSWEDTKANRQSDSMFIPIINNKDKSVSTNILTSFKEYSIYPILWKNIENDLSKLVS